MRDTANFPTWVPSVVRSLAREWIEQSLQAAQIAKERAGVAAIQEQQEAGRAMLRVLAKDLHKIAVAALNETLAGIVLHQQLLELENAIRRQAAGGAAAVKRAENAAAQRWKNDARTIKRIVADQHMRAVWSELDRRRANGKYMYPTRISAPLDYWRQPDPEPHRMRHRQSGKVSPRPPRNPMDKTRDPDVRFESADQWKQAQAYEQLFSLQVALSRHYRAASASEAERYRAAAAALHGQGNAELVNPEVDQHPRRRKVQPQARFAMLLRRASAAANQCAEAMLADDEKGRRQRLAGAISDKLRELFGQHMHGLTAIITSVILNEKVGRKTSRLAAAKRGMPQSG